MKLTTSRFVVDAVAVENKWAVRSIDAHGHRPTLNERQLQRQRISRCYIGVTLDLCGKLRWVNVAKAILVKSKTGDGWKKQTASAGNAKTCWQKTPNRSAENPTTALICLFIHLEVKNAPKACCALDSKILHQLATHSSGSHSLVQLIKSTDKLHSYKIIKTWGNYTWRLHVLTQSVLTKDTYNAINKIKKMPDHCLN